MWKIAEATVDDALGALSAREREEFTRMTAQVKGRLQSAGRRHAMTYRGQTWLRLALIVVVPLLAIAGGLLLVAVGRPLCRTDNAYVKAHIVQIAPEVSGQVRRVLVHDHASVAAGETLFTIESRPFRLALDSAEAELDAARTQVETLRGAWRETVTELADAEARADYFQRQWQRQEELATKGVASARASATNCRTTRAPPPTGCPR